MSGFRDFLYGHVLSYDRHLGQTYCRACEARGDGLDRRCPKAVDGEAAQARQDRETSRGPVEAARQSSDRGEPGPVTAPAIPDSSDRDLQLSKSPRIQGWTVNEWTRFVETHPDCTLPGGVGGAIVAELERQLAEAREEIAIDNQLLADRDRILDACPCPAHGRCVPYVMEQLSGLLTKAPRHP